MVLDPELVLLVRDLDNVPPQNELAFSVTVVVMVDGDALAAVPNHHRVPISILGEDGVGVLLV